MVGSLKERRRYYIHLGQEEITIYKPGLSYFWRKMSRAHLHREADNDNNPPW